MATVILARHGRSTSNTARTLAGRTPGVFLDDRGREQASHLGQRLRGIGLTAVVSSPLERCQQTTELALAGAQITLPIQLDDRVMETDYGQWSGQPLADLAALPQWNQVQTAPSTMTFPEGESMLAVRDRMAAAVMDWNARLGPEAVWLLVSHGDPIISLLSWALGMEFDRVQTLMVDPASVSILHFLTPPGQQDTAQHDTAQHDTAQPQPVRPDPSRQPDPMIKVATINSISGPLADWITPVEASLGGGLGGAGGSAGTDADPDRPTALARVRKLGP